LERENYARGGIMRIERSGALHFITTYYTMFTRLLLGPFRRLTGSYPSDRSRISRKMYKYVNIFVRFPAESTHQHDYAFMEGQTNRTIQNQNRGTWLAATYNALFLHHSECLYLERPTGGFGGS